MNIRSRKSLVAFWSKHPAAKASLSAWYDHVAKAEWASPQEVRADFNSADFVSDSRVIFNVGGNNYRIVARISYTFKNLMIKFVGTHKEYNDIDPNTV